MNWESVFEWRLVSVKLSVNEYAKCICEFAEGGFFASQRINCSHVFKKSEDVQFEARRFPMPFGKKCFGKPVDLGRNEVKLKCD